MALRRTLATRLLNISRTPSPAGTLEHSPISSPSVQNLVPSNAVKSSFHSDLLDSSDNGFFRRFLHRQAVSQLARLPEFLSVPVGDKLREKLRGMNGTGDRIRLDGLTPPVPEMRDPLEGISVEDARKLLRVTQMEKVKWTLRQIPRNSIPHSEFLQICVQVCSSKDQGAEFAKMLDDSGTVIVLGNTVILRPEQVARSMATLLSQSIASPNDPRRKEMEEMEKEKRTIDRKAKALVRRELFGGLGFLLLQTVGFMRLTFWELSWDVMEPICFFVTSLHFIGAYAFFLRTSKEPSFEGFFQRRFKAKQKQLMKTHNFDLEKYNHLRKLFYPNYPTSPHTPDHFPPPQIVKEGARFGALHP